MVDGHGIPLPVKGTVADRQGCTVVASLLETSCPSNADAGDRSESWTNWNTDKAFHSRFGRVNLDASARAAYLALRKNRESNHRILYSWKGG